ncbi:MAG TPA: InlB B-repeat-containing protein [Acholeplasmataceae bacterium]|nr:InlB B-repeat-containing protein [Acholeplasmataceae bacterium]
MKRVIVFVLFVLVIALSGCSSTITVTFESNGGNDVAARELKKGEALEELPNVSREGYDFGGWYLDEELKEEYKDQVIKKDTTLYAKWDIKKFTVKFLDYDDSIISEQSVNYGENAEAPENPVREGYGFTGWDKDYKNVKSDLVIKAKYEINKYKVVFVDDGKVLKEQTVNHGESAEAPEAPVHEGFEFVGWDKEFDEVKSDLTVTAQYEVKILTVIFQDHTGKQIGEAQKVPYGEDAVAPDDPIREGYDFEGWDKKFTNVTTDLIIKPKYTAIVYNIKYYDGDKELDHEPKTYTADDEIILTEFEKTGYKLVGWYLDEDFEEEIKKIEKGTTGNLILYGKWMIAVDLKYELNGGSWGWEVKSITDASKGIDADSGLPEVFMADFYLWLKENDLLTSNKVASKLHKTTWAEFKKNYTDPVAIYNHTSSNTSQNNDGYSQFFFEKATGNAITGEFITIEGGFLGTEPYKSKYFNLANHIAIMTHLRYTSNYFWDGPSGKSLAGFVLDGYFYGTQGAGTGAFQAFRNVIPNTNVRYELDGTQAKKVVVDYEPLKYVEGEELLLVSPFKEGHVFGGWYDNASFSGEPITKFAADEKNIPEKLYAKWISISSLE